MTPDKYTNLETFLEVGDGHTLYVQDWGNKTATTPILFLHGGPGDGCADKHKQLFDPEKQRVIFHDQRGSGRSLPVGSLEHNTTQELVADIEELAQHFAIESFVITGGSWGSTLAFAYALKHPKRAKALVLSGIFTGSKAESDWVEQGGYRMFYPDVWDRYLADVPPNNRNDPGKYYYEQVTSDEPQTAMQAGLTYQTMEGSLLSLDDRYIPDSIDGFDPTGVRLEMHYLRNGCFMPDRHIFANAHRLTLPIYLVQGRYDMVCPPAAAYELHQLLPNSRLIWTTSGHRNEHEAWNIMRTLLLQLTVPLC